MVNTFRYIIIAITTAMSLLIIMSCASSEQGEMAAQQRMIEEYFSPKLYGDIASQARQWKDFRGQLDPKDPSMAKINEFKEKYGYPLTFYPPKKGMPKSLSRVETPGGPCGTETTAFVKRLGGHESIVNYLSPDRVYEVDGSGKVLRSWTVPINRIVLAIQDDTIFVRDFGSQIRLDEGWIVTVPSVLAISPDGSYHLTKERKDYPEFESSSCPSNDLFPGSAYKRCWLFKDAGNGRDRLLIYQGPCT